LSHSGNVTDNWLWKKYVTFLHGYSTDPALQAKVQQAADAARGQPILVILDSEHTSGHVASEAQLYCPYATQGSYCIVQDTKISRWGSFWMGRDVGMMAYVAHKLHT
jgi:cephalosporin hydroxylase